MKSSLLIFFILCFFIVKSQDYSHLTGKANDIDIVHHKFCDININLDGYLLRDEEKKKIGNNLYKRKIDIIKIDSVYFLSSKIKYLINGEIFEKKERNNKLKSINQDSVISFDFYSKNEALKNFGIKTKNVLIKIETK